MVQSGKDITSAVTEPPCRVPLLRICWPFFPHPLAKRGGVGCC